MAKRTTKKTAARVGSVALYGTSRTGWGLIARTIDGRMFGDGEPKATRSATAALWLGLDALQDMTGARAGSVSITLDTDRGPVEATVEVTTRAYFGDLVFKPGTLHAIDAAAIIAAAEKEAR